MFLRLSDVELLRQCAVDLYRASGPGGQKRNKTSSAVRLRHGPTGIIVIAEEERSQHVNKARALRRLRSAIALTIRSLRDMETYQPSDLMRHHVDPQGRIKVSHRNESYPMIVSELLDVLLASNMQVSDAANRLGSNTAHLVSFVQDDPKLWEEVNRLRGSKGLRPLR